MTQPATAQSSSSASTARFGSSSRGGEAAGRDQEADFAASLTAVMTVAVSNEEEGKAGGETEGVAAALYGDAEIEVTITSFKGDDLLDHLSAGGNRRDATLSASPDGAIGVSSNGLFFQDNAEVQMGEGMTFTLPDDLGDVQGAKVTFSNLFGNDHEFESALVIAFDAEGSEVMRRLATGNDQGEVCVDINAGFKSLDFLPVDNGSWFLEDNSDFSIKLIDVATGEPASSDGGDAGSFGFVYDFLNFFEQRNFNLQDSVLTTHRSSVTDVFSNHGASQAVASEHRDDARIDDRLQNDKAVRP